MLKTHRERFGTFGFAVRRDLGGERDGEGPGETHATALDEVEAVTYAKEPMSLLAGRLVHRVADTMCHRR